VFKDNEKSYNECFKTKGHIAHIKNLNKYKEVLNISFMQLSVNNSFKMFKLLELIIYAIYLTVKIKQVLC